VVAVRRIVTVGLIKEFLLIVGFFSLVYGVWQIYIPAAWIIGGLLLLYVGIPRGE